MQVCTAKMNLSDEVDLEDYVSRPDKISAAEVILFCYLMAMFFHFCIFYCLGISLSVTL